MRPSALASPGGCQMWTLPSGLRAIFRPMRSSTVGSCCSAGRYSWLMIDGGTFQVGLTVMNFMSAVMIGVTVSGLPITIFVFQTCWPSCMTRSV